MVDELPPDSFRLLEGDEGLEDPDCLISASLGGTGGAIVGFGFAQIINLCHMLSTAFIGGSSPAITFP